jgi:hypothetical protein
MCWRLATVGDGLLCDSCNTAHAGSSIREKHTGNNSQVLGYTSPHTSRLRRRYLTPRSSRMLLLPGWTRAILASIWRASIWSATKCEIGFTLIRDCFRGVVRVDTVVRVRTTCTGVVACGRASKGGVVFRDQRRNSRRPNTRMVIEAPFQALAPSLPSSFLLRGNEIMHILAGVSPLLLWRLKRHSGRGPGWG